jgi:hypothetical protein
MDKDETLARPRFEKEEKEWNAGLAFFKSEQGRVTQERQTDISCSSITVE